MTYEEFEAKYFTLLTFLAALTVALSTMIYFFGKGIL